MPFIPLSYPQIVALTRKASERQPKAHFTKNEGVSPLELAHSLGHQEMVELLETKREILSRSSLVFTTRSATLESSSAPKSRTSGPG